MRGVLYPRQPAMWLGRASKLSLGAGTTESSRNTNVIWTQLFRLSALMGSCKAFIDNLLTASLEGHNSAIPTLELVSAGPFQV